MMDDPNCGDDAGPGIRKSNDGADWGGDRRSNKRARNTGGDDHQTPTDFQLNKNIEVTLNALSEVLRKKEEGHVLENAFQLHYGGFINGKKSELESEKTELEWEIAGASD